MSRLLVVRAHPLTSATSRSMQLADAFVETYKQTHPDDEVVEQSLYNIAVPEIDLDLLRAWNKLRAGVPFAHLHQAEQTKSTLFDGYTMQFLAMDKVVIANPLWNLQVPTRLKAWIDCICAPGKTFTYSETGEVIGMMSGKKALHIQTNGGVYNGQDPASRYVATVLGFIGVRDVQHIAAEGMDHDPTHADDIMASALDKVRVAAAEF